MSRIKYKLGVFAGDSLLDRQITRICSYLRSPEGDNFKITHEGGFAIRLANGTGADSVKGMAIEFSSVLDETYLVASHSFNVQGFVYEDGIPDGEQVWCVIKGVCHALLRDTFPVTPNLWVRLSAVAPGRVVGQNLPGYELPPESVVYTTGSTFSGTLSNLLIDSGTYLVIAEQAGVPGVDAVFTTPTPEHLDSIAAVGYYAGNHASGVLFQCWNFNTLSWDTKITFPPDGTTDVAYVVAGMSSDYHNGTEHRTRVYHPDAGNINHRIWIDKLVISSSGSQEHFKEIGHTMQSVAGGTNKLVKINLHLL